MQTTRGASLSHTDAGTDDGTDDAYGGGSGGSAAGLGLRPRRIDVLAVVASAVLLLDQLTKYLAVRRLTGSGPVEVVDGLLRLRLVRNPGAAFGIAGGATVVFTAVALVVVIAILRTAPRLRSAGWALALGLLLGGALGNLSDRVFRPPAVLRGHVVDFLELPHWPVFNAADSAIMSGAALLVLLSLLGRAPDGTSSHD